MKPYFKNERTTIYHGTTPQAMSTIESSSIDLIATSPPFNCRKPYAKCDDQWPWPEYYRWMGEVLDECLRVLLLGGVLAVDIPLMIRYQRDHEYAETWHDYDAAARTHRVAEKVVGRARVEPLGFHLLDMLYERGFLVREPVIWVKGLGPGEELSTRYMMGSDSNPFLRPTHDIILLASKGQWHHRGATGRRGGDAVPFEDYTKDVWYVSPEANPNHPAVWPEEIPRRLIKLFVHAADAVILDPFVGLGATLRAARERGLSSIGIDNSGEYCRLAVADAAQMRMFDA